jgi:hypothetical protein
MRQGTPTIRCPKLSEAREIRRRQLFQNFESELFNDGIREHIFRDSLDLVFCFVAAHAIEIQNEKFALPNVLDIGESLRSEGALDGLSLWIKNGGFQHYPHMCFHRRDYTNPAAFEAPRKFSSNSRLSIGGRNAALMLFSASSSILFLGSPSDSVSAYSLSKSV